MKRKRSQIRKARTAILNEADRLQKAGINVSHRFIVVGGARPKSVKRARQEREKK